MADGYNTNNTNNSAQFPDDIRAEGVKREGVSRKTRARSLRYLASIKHSPQVEIKHRKQIEMPPKQAPKFQLRNFSQNALAQLNAANAPARPQTQRNAKRAAILQKAKNKGKALAADPVAYKAFLELPVVNFSNNQTNAEIFGSSAENSPGAPKNLNPKQNGMAANANVNDFLAGGNVAPAAPATPLRRNKPVAGPNSNNAENGNFNAQVAGETAPAAKARTPKRNPFSPNLFEPNATTPPQVNPFQVSSNPFTPGQQLSSLEKNRRREAGQANFNSFKPNGNAEAFLANQPNNASAAASGAALSASLNANAGRMSANSQAQSLGIPNAQGNVEATGFAAPNSTPSYSTLSTPGLFGKRGNINTGINVNAARGGRYMGVGSRPAASLTEVGGSSIFNSPYNALQNNSVTGGLVNVRSNAKKADYTIEVVDSTVPTVPIGGKIGVVITPKIGGGFSIGMPGMPSMPSMPSWSLPKISIKLPKFPTIRGFDTTPLIEALLSILPDGKKLAEKLGALSEAAKNKIAEGLALAGTFVAGGWNLTVSIYNRLTGALMSLPDYMTLHKDPEIKELSKALKLREELAKRAVREVIDLAKRFETRNKRLSSSADSRRQITMILSDYVNNLEASHAKIVERSKAIIAKSTQFKDLLSAEGADDFETLLKALSASFEAMTDEQVGIVPKRQAADFAKMVENYKKMTGIPAAMLAKIEDTSIADEKFVSILLEEGRNARDAASKAGYNISQGFKTARRSIGGLFGKSPNMTNKNKNMKAAAAVGANSQPKKTWRNKLGNFWGSTKRFFTRSKNGNGKSPFTAAGPSAMVNPNNVPNVNLSNPMKQKQATGPVAPASGSRQSAFRNVVPGLPKVPSSKPQITNFGRFNGFRSTGTRKGGAAAAAAARTRKLRRYRR